MADEREDEESGPKIRVVDRRMLNEDERAGKGTPPAAAPPAPAPVAAAASPVAPAATAPVAPPAHVHGPDCDHDHDHAHDHSDEEELSDAEMEQMRDQVEQEQFAAIAERMGRDLTEDEKTQVRAELDREARSMAALEVAPVLQRIMAELSARAAIHMGLMPNPYTRLIAKNDAEARLAIDAFGALYELLKPTLDPTSQREYARVLNDLRVNFASAIGPIGGGALGSSGSRIIH